MSDAGGHSADRVLKTEITSLLEETFVKQHGAFLDKGTTFFETLAEIDHVLASRQVPGHAETIAGHVYHARFYLTVLRDYMAGTLSGRVNWSESWVVTRVDKETWKRLVEELEAEYRNVMEMVGAVTDWDDENTVGGLLAVLAHSAYHLGAIRQLKDVITN